MVRSKKINPVTPVNKLTRKSTNKVMEVLNGKKERD